MIWLVLRDQSLNQTGKPELLSLCLTRHHARCTGIRFDYAVTDQPFAEFLNSMKDGAGPDLTTTLVRSPEREAFLSFSNGYLETPLVIFARSEADFISDIQGLTGKKVGVVNGTQVHRQIVDGFPEIDLVPFGYLGQ